MVCMHLLRIVSVFLTCFSMAAATVLGGVGCSLAMVVRVWLAEFSKVLFHDNTLEVERDGIMHILGYIG